MKKNKIKFNVLDTAIVVFVAAIMVCAYFSANDKIITLLHHKNQDAIITLVTDNDVYENLSVNDTVDFYDTDKRFGEVLSVVKRKKFDYKESDEGVVIKQLSEDKFEYVVRIKTNVKTNAEGTFINSSTFCATGSYFELFSDNTFFSGYVENIKII